MFARNEKGFNYYTAFWYYICTVDNCKDATVALLITPEAKALCRVNSLMFPYVCTAAATYSPHYYGCIVV